MKDDCGSISAKIPLITTKMDKLQEAISNVTDILDRLESKLRPVLCDSRPEKSVPGKDKELMVDPSSLVTVYLNEQTMRLEYTVTRLEDIYQRCEL